VREFACFFATALSAAYIRPVYLSFASEKFVFLLLL